MPFNHNDHYHRLLVRQLPPGCRSALDVGCGTGQFARRLARHRIEVDAIDPSADSLKRARELSAGILAPGTIRWRRADVTTLDLPSQSYDFISCIASIHHVPFETVSKLRDALAPGGVLAILGLYTEATVTDHAVSLAAVPLNVAARLTVAVTDRMTEVRPAPAKLNGYAGPATKPPTMTLAEIRDAADKLLPGSVVRRQLFWRYLLVYRND
jgi:SAM-dependent methyltransferase